MSSHVSVNLGDHFPANYVLYEQLGCTERFGERLRSNLGCGKRRATRQLLQTPPCQAQGRAAIQPFSQ